MATAYDNIKTGIEKKPWLKTILGVVFAVLSFGKSKGLFNKDGGPVIGTK